MGQWGHSSAPAKIILMYIIYEFTIFIAYLLREPEQSVLRSGGVPRSGE